MLGAEELVEHLLCAGDVRPQLKARGFPGRLHPFSVAHLDLPTISVEVRFGS
jgi:hypothetical protein